MRAQRSAGPGARILFIVAAAACAAHAFAAQPAPDLTTVAERSGYETTGRYEEVERLAASFEREFRGKVSARTFGTTPEGRPMIALVASADGTLDPGVVRKKQRPVILAQGGIHPGEIDGKDAGVALLRDVLRGGVARGALDAVTLVFVPVFNIDGHERFGPNQRPNQRGPKEGGWRTTASNLNLNRDYTKADAPEMQALLRLLDAYDPAVYVDLHVTDGARFRHDVAVTIDPAEALGHPLRASAQKLQEGVLAKLTAAGNLPLPFYPSFRKDDDPASGFAVGPSQPRFSTGYWAARGRFGMLVETHSWHSYAERVSATRNVLVALLELAAAGEARNWQRDIEAAQRQAEGLGGKDVVVEWKAGEASRPIDFLGYAYERFPSPVSGQMSVRYDESRPETWRVPLFDEAAPLRTIEAPRAGYVVPPAQAGWIADKLDLHGIRFVRLASARTGVDVAEFRATEAKFADKPFEGRVGVRVRGAWQPSSRDLAAGSLFVPVAQPGARLVVQLFEPEAPDSFVSWGFFHSMFERKEFLESYVTEEWAERVLREDSAVRAEFEKRLATDTAFAASPTARLEFFERLHPSWDTRKDLYPVVRVAADPTASAHR